MRDGVVAIDRLTRSNLTQVSDACAANLDCAPAFDFWIPADVAASDRAPALPNNGNLTSWMAGKPDTLDNIDAAHKQISPYFSRLMQVYTLGQGSVQFISAGENWTGDPNSSFNDKQVMQLGTSLDNTREFALRLNVSNCPTGGCALVLAWTGHLASNTDWGAGQGAALVDTSFGMRVLGVDQDQGLTGGFQEVRVQPGTVRIPRVALPLTDSSPLNRTRAAPLNRTRAATNSLSLAVSGNTCSWTGATNNIWSTPANWSGCGGVAPQAGDALIFPSGAANKSNNNDLTAGTNFNSITLSGSGYTLAGNQVALGSGGLTDSASSGGNTISLNISLPATGTVGVTNAVETLSVSGIISGTGGVTKAGSGTLTLSRANTYTGATTINAGTLIALNLLANGGLASNIGASTSATANLVLAGGTLQWGPAIDDNSPGNAATDRGFTLADGTTSTISIQSRTSLTLSGDSATSTGSLIKSGNGFSNLILSGTNHYSGTTTVAVGTLQVGNGGTAGTLGSGNVTVGSANRLIFNRSDAFTVNNIIAGAGQVRKDGTGNLTLSGANIYTGTTVIVGGTISVSADNNLGTAPASATSGNINFSGGTLAVTDSFTLNANRGIIFVGNGNINVASTKILTYGGIAVQSGLTKTGSGTLILSGANTYTGTTSINAGVLMLSANNAVPSGSALSVSAGATFDLAGFSDTVGSLAGAGSVTSSTAGAATLTVGQDTSTTFSGVIQNGSGVISLVKTGSGTLTLSGSNSYSGTTTVSAGTLAAGAGQNFAGNVVIATGATFSAGSFSHSFGRDLTNGGTFTAGTSTVTFNGTANQSIGGTIPTTFNNLAVNKGSGSLTLAADETVNGTLTLTGGIVSTGANTLIIGSGGSVSRGSGTNCANGTSCFIDGNLRKPVTSTGSGRSMSFEVGSGPAYAPISLSNTTFTAAGTLTAASIGGDPPNFPGNSGISSTKYIKRDWRLTPGGGLAASSYNVTLTFVASDVQGGANTSALIVRKADGGTWTAPVTSSSTATTATASGFTSFSDYAVGETAPLDHFVVTPATSTPSAGVAFNVNLTAINTNGTMKTDYTGNQCLTFSGPGSSPNLTAPSYPARGSCTSGSAVSFSNGIAGAVSITLYKAETVTLRVTDNPSSKYGETSLTISAAALDHLVLSPATATVVVGQDQTYTARGQDVYNNDAGDVTTSTTFTISPDGACVGATCTPSAPGTHTVTGTNSLKTGTASVTVNKASTSTNLVSSAPSGSTYGDPITFTATVPVSLPGAGSPGGSVVFKDGTTILATVTLSGGQAQYTTASLAGGSASPHSITAVYSGDTNFYGSTSSVVSQTITPRAAFASYIGQTLFVTSGSSSTSANATLTASIQDPIGSLGSVANATVTFTDLLSGKILASGVKVSLVKNTDTSIGTANVVVTLSTGSYGAQEYLIEVRLGSSYTNDQQTKADPTSDAYKAAHAAVTAMIPATLNSMQGVAAVSKLSTSAGTYGDATGATYTVGMKYNNKGSSPQGQIQLVLSRSDGTYYIKSNSITSLAFFSKSVTIYTKASIYKIDSLGNITTIDGNVTLRVDAQDGCTTGTCATNDGDAIGFTVLSTKTSALYYSNNWTYDSGSMSWSTGLQPVGNTNGTAVVIN